MGGYIGEEKKKAKSGIRENVQGGGQKKRLEGKEVRGGALARSPY